MTCGSGDETTMGHYAATCWCGGDVVAPQHFSKLALQDWITQLRDWEQGKPVAFDITSPHILKSNLYSW